MTAEELHKQQMLEPDFKKWYETRPPAIQELARKYPYDTYIIKEGAPYGLSCPGQLVHFYCFSNEDVSGMVGMKVVVRASEKTPASKEHEEYLFNLHNMKARGHTIEEIHSKDVLVEIDPIWLEPITLFQ